MSEVKDVPIEVRMSDGSLWIVYKRCRSFADALGYLRADVVGSQWLAAAETDGVQRDRTQINAAQIVSIREVAGG